MDRFIASVKPQTIRLNGYDSFISILTIPIYYWYDKPVPKDVLEVAFYKTLEEFPILAGHVKTGNDMLDYVEIDRNNLNMPVYIDVPCNVDFQTLQQSGYNVNFLPGDYSSVYKTPCLPGMFGNSLKIAEFYVFRLKNNSGMGIFAGIRHIVFDGSSFCAFMNRWAEISKSILAAQKQDQDQDIQDIRDIGVPARVYEFDRSILESYKPRGTDALEPEVCHMFALATILFAQALHKTGRLEGEAVFLSNFVADIRPRVKRLANTNYIGNAFLQRTVGSPLAPLLEERNPQILASVACNVRKTVNSISEQYCDELGSLYYSNPSGYANMYLQMPKIKNLIRSTNHSRFTYYNADFGSGIPINVHPEFYFAENGLLIMPVHPSQTGYDLWFLMAPEVAKAMMESDYRKLIH
ncbi:hypothetical protein EV175_005992 [Coemansia sp. RSA 1933]|nr:hypothetical protein EV175_005992 [Coemansia sp. RSA 1933]